MSDTIDTLILDLLEWIGPNPRPYRDVLEAWRTWCPALPVWEDANDRGFIARHHSPSRRRGPGHPPAAPEAPIWLYPTAQRPDVLRR
jgi:hypothetical protein